MANKYYRNDFGISPDAKHKEIKGLGGGGENIQTKGHGAQRKGGGKPWAIPSSNEPLPVKNTTSSPVQHGEKKGFSL